MQLITQCLVFWLQQTECSYNKNYRGATATSVVKISSGDEYSLQSAVANVGPLSAYVDASHSSFQVCECLHYHMHRVTLGISYLQLKLSKCNMKVRQLKSLSEL